MPAITIPDLNKAKQDVDHIADVATSTAMTATDRLGGVKPTVRGAVNTLAAFNARGVFAGDTAYALKDTYTSAGIAYVAVVAHTSTSVAADLAAGKVTVHQGATREDVARVNGLPMFGYLGDEVQATLDDAKPLATYTALRAYTGRATGIRITTVDVAGLFQRSTTDTTSADNGGTIIVDGGGRRWMRLFTGPVFVTWFGAKGDSNGTTGTDNTVFIQKAADYCATFAAYDVGRCGPALALPESFSQGYLVTGPIVVKSGIPVEMRNTSILYAGAANITVLTLGEVASRSFRTKYTGLDVRRTGNLTRSSETDIGIRIINAFFCEIELRGARGFGIGAQLNGVNPGEGCYYNRVSWGFFFGNKINLDLKGGDGTAAGWVNENIFIGGECQGGSNATNDTFNRYGVRVWNTPAGTIFNDNNLFIKPSFEMNGPAGYEAIPFLIQNSDGLKVISARQEGLNSAVFARILNDSKNTDLHVAHQRIGESSIDDQSLHKSTTLQSQKVNWQHHGRPIFISGNLGKQVARFDATKHHVPALHFYRQVNTALFNASGPIVSTSGNKLTMGAADAIARMIDTSRCKKFTVNIDADAGSYPWIVVQCFDAAGAVLTSAGAGHPYVAGPGFIWSAAWNGYAKPDSIESERLFTVHADVKSVRVGIYAGTLRAFSIHALGIDNQMAATWAGYEEGIPGAHIATAAPTDGTWAVGAQVLNAAPAASGFIGWVCTLAGTPGTWKTFGVISA